MANLNEDVLCHIFDYLPTPLQWIEVSRVCKLWKQAASRQWWRIREINYSPKDLEKKLKPGDADNAPLISTEDCDKIVYSAAPFVKTLIGCSFMDDDKGPETLVMFGPFLYKVDDFGPVETMELLENNATGITEVHFDAQPFLELKELFRNNKIKKATIETSLAFYNHFHTNYIEELTMGFICPSQIRSFEGKLPNLKKLNLEIKFYEDPIEPQTIFSKFLLHIPRVTSLSLHFKGNGTKAMSCRALMDIAKLSQLEHLIINNHFSFNLVAANFFLTKLVKGCPKLRSVELIEMRMSGNQLRTLLGLPLLEKLTAHRVSDFESLMELPELSNLRELDMKYSVEKCDLTSFGNVLQKMPNLRILKMDVDCFARSRYHMFTCSETFNLVKQVAKVAASQNKDIVVEDFDRHPNRKNSVKVKILRRNVETDAESRKLTVRVSFCLEQDTLVRRLQKFVRVNLENYYTMVVDEAED